MEKIPRQHLEEEMDKNSLSLDQIEILIDEICDVLKSTKAPAILGLNALANVLVNTMINLEVTKHSYLDFCERIFDGVLDDMDARLKKSEENELD